MRRITHFVPWEHRFKINRRILDSRFGDLYMGSRRAFAPYRAEAESKLVIEGFPRSANTYALFAAEEALGQGSVRGHTHAAATVHKGTKLGVPTLVIVREPRAAVASLLQLANGVTPEIAFDAYTRFHSKIMPIRSQVCIAGFDEVVSDFGGVMERVNAQFGVSLMPYRKSDENEALIRSRIDESSAARQGGLVREAGVARPSGQRRSVSDVLDGMGPRAERSAARADHVYVNFKSSCA